MTILPLFKYPTKKQRPYPCRGWENVQWMLSVGNKVSMYVDRTFPLPAENIKKGPVQASPDNFETAAFFLRLGLPSTLIRLEKTDLFENLQTSAAEQKNRSQARAIPLKNGFEVGRSVNTIFLSKLN